MAHIFTSARDFMQTLDLHQYPRFVRGTFAKHLFLVLVAVAAGLTTAGCKKVAVPDVMQQDVDQAKQILATSGLKPGNITGAQGTGSYVVAQTPGPGQQVRANTQVDLTVELPVAVPDLTNSSLTDAVSTLQGAGLTVAFVKQRTMRLFGGPKVITQSPLPATMARRGATVTLTVAAPPDLGVLVGMVTKEPAYAKLNPEYRQTLDAFLK